LKQVRFWHSLLKPHASGPCFVPYGGSQCSRRVPGGIAVKRAYSRRWAGVPSWKATRGVGCRRRCVANMDGIDWMAAWVSGLRSCEGRRGICFSHLAP
jgi:hypothetical protein